MKRSCSVALATKGVERTKKQRILPKYDLMMKLPPELVDTIIVQGNLTRKDVINLSTVSSSHRARFFDYIFRQIKLTWSDFKRFDQCFKHKDLVMGVRVYSQLDNPKQTSYGEWNISLKDILVNCPNLFDFTIEVMTSARCLKYQDKFDVDISDKIKSMTLISHAHEAADESLFELSQIQRFHSLQSLRLKGFFISKDQFFYPSFKPDLSDFKIRSKDGRLLDLDNLELVNCRWEHPYNLSDIFSPTYPSPNPMLFHGMEKDQFTAPTSISLFYNDESSDFVASERFQSFINNENDPQFLFQTRFFSKLRNLKLVILNSSVEVSDSCYYPWLGQLNLKRKFQVHSITSGEIASETILTNLESLTLVGWRLANAKELDKIFEINTKIKYNMKHLSIYIIPTGTLASKDAGKREDEMKSVQDKLEEIFNGEGRNNHCCKIEVGLAEQCLRDKRYETSFSKLE